MSLSRRTRKHLRVSLVYWLCVAGLSLWVGLSASGQVAGTPPVQLGPMLAILALAVANLAARSYERVRRELAPSPTRTTVLGWVFVTVELTLLALGLRFTGGVHSPLWIVLFLVGVAETLLATAWEAVLIRCVGVLALILGTMPSPIHQADGAYWLEIALRSGFFWGVASVTRRIREENDEKERENAGLRAELGLADERSKMSREVHDGVGNSLAATVLRLELAARTLEKTKPDDPGAAESAAMLKDEANALREAMTAVRDWTFFTRPWSARTAGGGGDTLPPSATVAAEVARLSRRTGLPMTVEGGEELDRLPPITRLTVMRIIQEALTNAAKHAAGATRAEVRLCREGPLLLLSVADDGAGFDSRGGDGGAGIGLSSMRERAEGMGGTLAVDSAPGLGTTVTASLPVS